MLPSKLTEAIAKIADPDLAAEIARRVEKLDADADDDIEIWKSEIGYLEDRIAELEDAEELADERAAVGRQRMLDVRKWSLEDAARACAAAGEPVPEKFLRELAHQDYVAGLRRLPV